MSILPLVSIVVVAKRNHEHFMTQVDEVREASGTMVICTWHAGGRFTVERGCSYIGKMPSESCQVIWAHVCARMSEHFWFEYFCFGDFAWEATLSGTIKGGYGARDSWQ